MTNTRHKGHPLVGLCDDALGQVVCSKPLAPIREMTFQSEIQNWEHIHAGLPPHTLHGKTHSWNNTG